MPEDLWAAANSLTTNENARFLAIGNPDIPESKFQEICQPGSGWNVIHIPAHSTPNFTGEKVSQYLKDNLTTKLWVQERADEWGEDSPLYISKVLAEFPTDSEDGVVPASKLLKCRLPKELKGEELKPVHLGVDVGAGGGATPTPERRGRQAGKSWGKRARD